MSPPVTRNGISDAQADALAAARAPYSAEYRQSRSPLRPPRGLYELLRWYEEATLAEIPSALHQRAVWAEYVTITDDVGAYQVAGGGSALGAHAWSDDFRRYLEASPFTQDIDGTYRFPVRAALRKLEGVGGREAVTRWRTDPAASVPAQGALFATLLRDVARNAFSFTDPCRRLGWIGVEAALTQDALEALYVAYRAEAPARPLREAA